MKKIFLCILLVLLLASCITQKKAVEEPIISIEEIIPIEEEVLSMPQEEVVEEVILSPSISEGEKLPPTTEEEEVLLPDPVSPPIELPTEEVTSPFPSATQTTLNDDAVLGSIRLPRWFVYIATFLICAILATLCYISNQKKKSFLYGSRRE